MYSIVLLAAVSGGPNTSGADVTPAPVVVAGAPVVGGVYAGCGGCSGVAVGCSGYGSCYGSGYGCSGSCHGRGGFLGMRHGCRGGGLFGHHKSSCHGCGGGYSCSGYSCFGSGHGCYGSAWGSCHGSGYGYGGYAGCWGSGQGCYGSYSYPAYSAPGYATPPVVVPAETPMTKPVDKPKTGDESGANLKFHLPAEATLFVDGRPVAGTGAERTFFTPPLAAGQKYFYDVRAEVRVGGQVVTEEKRVIVAAGADLTESFPKLFAALSTGSNAVAGK